MQKISAFRRFLPVLCVLALMCVVGPAFAQTSPPAYDAGVLATSGADGVKDAAGSAAPVGFTLLAIMLGIGIAWKVIKRGAKS